MSSIVTYLLYGTVGVGSILYFSWSIFFVTFILEAALLEVKIWGVSWVD